MKKTASLYIHWPFCLSKCPYCDFNSHVNSIIDKRKYLHILIDELKYWHDQTNITHIKSIFFGGGTPSLMNPADIAYILNEVNKLFALNDKIEISMEANPTSSESNKFQDFHNSGINRISIGVQSFNENALRFLGREHDVTQAIRTIEMAANIFPRYSFDLIYALPEQKLSDWEKELKFALTLADNHISLYQLTIEEGTIFNTQHKKGSLITPNEDYLCDAYIKTEEIITASDFHNYEISNYAKEGAECLHNLNYWLGGDYIGIGAGAHGRLSYKGHFYATNNIKNPRNYIDIINSKGFGGEILELSTFQRQEEIAMTMLRTKYGINKEFNDIININELQKLQNMGYMENLTLTLKGRLLLDYIIGRLL